VRPYKITSIVFVVLLILLDIAYLGGIIEWWWLAILLILYVHALVLGAIYIQWDFFIRSYNRGKNSRFIAITFDDGPAEYTGRILDVLTQGNVEAAFFSIGKNAVQNPELVKRWHREGHLIGNHSYYHGFNFDWQSSKKMAAEMEQTNQAIMEIAGVRPKLFRPPYGVTNPNLARAVERTGMYSIGWNVRSFDTKIKDPKKLLSRILNKLQGGDIVLLHDSMAITAEILTEFIVQARQKGYTFVRVDKLLGIEAYA